MDGNGINGRKGGKEAREEPKVVKRATVVDGKDGWKPPNTKLSNT